MLYCTLQYTLRTITYVKMYEGTMCCIEAVAGESNFLIVDHNFALNKIKVKN